MPTTLKRANVKVKVDGQFQDLGLLQSDIATQLADEIAERKSNDNSLEANKIPYPLNPNSKYGNLGDILTTDGNGNTKWIPKEMPRDDLVQDAINNWLAEHPEATTTVQDKSISDIKLVQSLQNKVNAVVPVTLYSNLVNDNDDDWTNALQTAINENNTVIVNRDIKIYGTVTIPANKTIKLDAISVTKPSNATNTDPIFYLGYRRGSLIGCGNSSLVISYVDSPDGIIKIGQPSNTTDDESITFRNIEFCFVSGMRIQGKDNANSNVGVHLCGTYKASNFPSWFHTITNLSIYNVAMGIVLNNAANANIITNIEFWECGYDKTTGAFCFIRTQDENYDKSKIPFENTITNAFHHHSLNASTIFIGTATGLNRIDNIICEPGAESGKASYGCYISHNDTISSNTPNVINITYETTYGIKASNDDLLANFLKYNRIETQNISRINSIVCNSLSTDSLSINGAVIQSNGKLIYDIESTTNLTRNTDFTIGTFGKYTTASHINRSCIVDITGITTFSSGIASMAEYSTQKYRIIYDANTYTIEEITTKTGTLELSINSTGELILHTKQHSGGSTTRIGAKILVEIYGYTPPTPFTIVDTTNFSRIN